MRAPAASVGIITRARSLRSWENDFIASFQRDVVFLAGLRSPSAALHKTENCRQLPLSHASNIGYILDVTTSSNPAHRPTHVAYADESRYNVGRYRGIALVTMATHDALALQEELCRLLSDSGLAEFKWKHLHGAKQRFAALKLLDSAVCAALRGTAMGRFAGTGEEPARKEAPLIGAQARSATTPPRDRTCFRCGRICRAPQASPIEGRPCPHPMDLLDVPGHLPSQENDGANPGTHRPV